MFNGQQQGGHQHRQEPQNVPSDSNWYQQNYENGIRPHSVKGRKHRLISSKAHCDNYLCPDTLACVHFPHHCPCPHPIYEEKFELGEGKAICISKGGFKAGEAARKVELARKGLL